MAAVQAAWAAEECTKLLSGHTDTNQGRPRFGRPFCFEVLYLSRHAGSLTGFCSPPRFIEAWNSYRIGYLFGGLGLDAITRLPIRHRRRSRGRIPPGPPHSPGG